MRVGATFAQFRSLVHHSNPKRFEVVFTGGERPTERGVGRGLEFQDGVAPRSVSEGVYERRMEYRKWADRR